MRASPPVTPPAPDLKPLTDAALEEIRVASATLTWDPTGIERREIDSGYFTYIVYGPKGDIASTTDELNPRAKRSAEFLLAATPERVQALVIELMILRKRALTEPDPYA